MTDQHVTIASLSSVATAADEHARWDRYVLEHTEGTFFHRAGWKNVIESAFGHSMHMLYAERDGAICGVLPLGNIRSRLFGNSLISVPFCVYGGALADSDEVRQQLEQRAHTMAAEQRVAYVEYRHRKQLDRSRPCKADLYVTFRKAISEDDEENMKAIPRKQRAMVRKGIKGGLVSTVEHDSAQLYACYAESVRNLGTPVFSRRYFQILLEEFGNDVDIVTISKSDGEVVSSVMNFYFRDEVLPYYGGGTLAARSCYANDFMYWEVMRRAAERGARLFDYGRSKVDTGPYKFKKNWGFEPEPLFYEYDLVTATEIPNISPTNPKYKMMVDAWQRLPLWLSNTIGPHLAKDLG